MQRVNVLFFLGAALVAGVALIAVGIAEEPSADLAIAARFERGDASATGDARHIVFDVRNEGPRRARDVKVTVRLSPGLVYQGSPGNLWRCRPADPTVVCELTILRSGEQSTLRIAATGPTEPQNVWCTAGVLSATADPSYGNNRAEAFLPTVRPDGDLQSGEECGTGSGQSDLPCTPPATVASAEGDG